MQVNIRRVDKHSHTDNALSSCASQSYSVLTSNDSLASPNCSDINELSGRILFTLIKDDALANIVFWHESIYCLASVVCKNQKSKTDKPLAACCSMITCHSWELRLAVINSDDV